MVKLIYGTISHFDSQLFHCFEVHNSLDYLENTKWVYISGAVKSEACGLLLSGTSMYFNGKGTRMLTTVDLNLLVARLVHII